MSLEPSEVQAELKEHTRQIHEIEKTLERLDERINNHLSHESKSHDEKFQAGLGQKQAIPSWVLAILAAAALLIAILTAAHVV